MIPKDAIVEILQRREAGLLSLYGTFNELTDPKMVDDTLEEIATVQSLMLDLTHLLGEETA